MRIFFLQCTATILLTLTACEKAPPSSVLGEDKVDAPANADDAKPQASDISDWTGKWTGIEGMYAKITQSPDNRITLEMQSDLDTNGTYEGVKMADGIRFSRAGATLLLKKSDGDATGLKYLAGKKDCVMVKSGEGYCRD